MDLSDEPRFPLMPWVLIVLCLFFVLPPLHAADIEFVTQELPWAVLNRGYAPLPLAARASGACPLGGISFAVVSGELPPGLQLSRLGYLSGTPLQVGSFEIAVRVSNGCTWTARHFVLTVAEAPALAASPGELEFDTGSLQPQMIKLSSTWPHLAYQASSSMGWLAAIPEKGFLPDNLRVNVDTKTLKPGRYEGEITVSAWQASGALRITVILTVTD